MMAKEKSIRIAELLVRCCDGEAEAAEWAELDALADSGLDVAEYCIELLLTLSCLHATSLSMSRRLATTMNRLAAETPALCDASGTSVVGGRPHEIVSLELKGPKKCRRVSKTTHKDLEDKPGDPRT